MSYKRTLRPIATIIVAVVAVFGLAALPTLAQDNAQATPVPMPMAPGAFPENTITVTGIGTASGEPDVAYIELGVEMANADLGAAYTEAADTMQQVIAALVDMGIDRADIRTSSVNVYPQDNYNPETGQPTDRTYRVSNTIRITVRSVADVEPVINTAVNAGANSIYNFNFGILDSEALEQAARESAVENARARAEQLAAALGVSVGRPVVISESYGQSTPPIPYYGRGGAGYDMASSNLPVESGQLDVTVQILVTFELQ
jgi:uncharacterized protein YggE